LAQGFRFQIDILAKGYFIMFGKNSVQLEGNLTHEPKLLNNNVVRLRLAVDTPSKTKTANFFDIVCFRDVATQVSTYKKGNRILIDGSLKNNSYQKKLADGTEFTVYGNEIIANSVNLIFGNKDEENYGSN
jgi:single-stranded DNA-binding protein